MYRGARYALLAAGGISRPAIAPEEEEGGDDIGTRGAACTAAATGGDNAEPQAGAAPAEPLLRH
jgi:hypothetical protein